MTFQQSMTRLEQIVEQLNAPDLELEKAMELFKEGLVLSKDCEKKLSEFENQLNELIVDENETIQA